MEWISRSELTGVQQESNSRNSFPKEGWKSIIGQVFGTIYKGIGALLPEDGMKVEVPKAIAAEVNSPIAEILRPIAAVNNDDCSL